MLRDAREPTSTAAAFQTTDVPVPRPLTAARPALARQFLTFAAVGAVGTAAHFAVLVLLVEALDFSPAAATTVGFVCGAVVNYALNRRFTFVSARSHRAALPQFLLVAALG